MGSTQSVAMYLQDAHPIRDAMGYVQYAEAKGFDAVYQAESRLVREAVVPMAAFAAVPPKPERLPVRIAGAPKSPSLLMPSCSEPISNN